MWVVHPHSLQVHYLSSSVGEALPSHRLCKLTGNISTYSPNTHTALSYTSPPTRKGRHNLHRFLRTCSRSLQQDFCCLICCCRAQNDENRAASRGNTMKNLLCVFLSHFLSFVAKQLTILISQINTRAVHNCCETVARQHTTCSRG